MIVEIWRKGRPGGIPVRFAVGDAPQFINGEGNLESVQESPPVKSINFYAAGAFGGKAWRDECFVVQFADSPMRRIIPMGMVEDILWEVQEKKTDAVTVPDLEE